MKADYSQIELRVAAAVANEPAMLAAYAAGRDLHRIADNQTATIAEWDDTALVHELLELRDAGFGLTARLAAADAGLTVRQVLVWAKSAFALGRFDYHWKHETCLCGWVDGAAHSWLGGRDQSTVLEFDRPSRNAEHPTMKPVGLFAKLIENSCPRGGIVLDPFAGSGTAVIAAEQTGRTAAVVELDPGYCDVVVARYESVTGKTTERIPAN